MIELETTKLPSATLAERSAVPCSALLGRLGEIARKHCSTYPGISTADAWEQLYAIECTMEGVSAANDDLHALIAMLRERCGMTAVEVVEMWEQKRPNK